MGDLPVDQVGDLTNDGRSSLWAFEELLEDVALSVMMVEGSIRDRFFDGE